MRPGETFAEYLERWHDEIATPEELAELEVAAKSDRARRGDPER